jgi:hypothetical protein
VDRHEPRGNINNLSIRYQAEDESRPDKFIIKLKPFFRAESVARAKRGQQEEAISELWPL